VVTARDFNFNDNLYTYGQAAINFEITALRNGCPLNVRK